MLDKKAGILTFHKSFNYGAILQAYALKEIFEDLGYEAKIIDYITIDAEDNKSIHYKIAHTNGIKNKLNIILRYLLISQSMILMKYNYKKFINKHISKSTKCNNKKDIISLKYDVYVAGSDQIWNYRITGYNFDDVYFLDFNNSSKNIIYAASSQDVPFEKKYEDKFKLKLHNNKACISIREKQLAEYIYNITGEQYPVVLDPTLLGGKAILDRIKKKTIMMKKKYIVLYQIERNCEVDISYESLKNKFNNYDIITFSHPRLGCIAGRKGYVGPDTFLAYLNSAEFIVTNSFHGVALSIIYEKRFFVYPNNGVMTRINNLIEESGLEERRITSVNDINENSIINYTKVNSRLDDLRKKSFDFLRKSLA